jgi:hypothetical protein
MFTVKPAAVTSTGGDAIARRAGRARASNSDAMPRDGERLAGKPHGENLSLEVIAQPIIFKAIEEQTAGQCGG